MTDTWPAGVDSYLWPSLALLLDLCSLFPASPTCLLPAISSFDLCCLTLILWGVSGVVIEGDGVNIRDWHFSLSTDITDGTFQCCQHRWRVLRSSPLLFTDPEGELRTFSVNVFFFQFSLIIDDNSSSNSQLHLLLAHQLDRRDSCDYRTINIQYLWVDYTWTSLVWILNIKECFMVRLKTWIKVL